MLEGLALDATCWSLEADSFAICVLLHTDIVADGCLIMRGILGHRAAVPAFASLAELRGIHPLSMLTNGLGTREDTHGLVLAYGLNFTRWRSSQHVALFCRLFMCRVCDRRT